MTSRLDEMYNGLLPMKSVVSSDLDCVPTGAELVFNGMEWVWSYNPKKSVPEDELKSKLL